jgi:hypothetical protein
MIAMKNSEINLEKIKASLDELRKKLHLKSSIENKFAAQNKEYLMSILKSIE